MNKEKLEAILNGAVWAAGSLLVAIGVGCAVYLANFIFDWRLFQ